MMIGALVCRRPARLVDRHVVVADLDRGVAGLDTVGVGLDRLGLDLLHATA